MTAAESGARVAATADVSEGATVGSGTSIWHLAQIREGAELGEGCILGRGAYVGSGVRIGNNCKIQNHALVYEPAVLGDGVFVGPGAVLTNDHFPRAINPDGSRKAADDWEQVGVTVGTGASIGAHATCVAPVSIGSWALVAAGAVVIEDVGDYALVAGVPARRVGWVGPSGRRLKASGDGTWMCPSTGDVFHQRGDLLEPAPSADPSSITTVREPQQ